MVTKGIITEVISDYKAKVRIPLYDSVESAKGSTLDKDLSIATVCTLPNLTHPVNVGDVVYVSFEDGDKSKPVILGHLHKESKTKTKVNLDVGNITTNSTTQLGYQTSIGNIRPVEIARLTGVKENIQHQIDSVAQFKPLLDDISAKSKNLLVLKDYNITEADVTITSSYANQLFTIEGKSGAMVGTSIEIPVEPVTLKANVTYFYSQHYLDGSLPTGTFIYLYSSLSKERIEVNTPYTPNQDTLIDTIYVDLLGHNYNYAKIYMQLEIGDEVTNWSNPSGGIVFRGDPDVRLLKEEYEKTLTELTTTEIDTGRSINVDNGGEIIVNTIGSTGGTHYYTPTYLDVPNGFTEGDVLSVGYGIIVYNPPNSDGTIIGPGGGSVILSDDTSSVYSVRAVNPSTPHITINSGKNLPEIVDADFHVAFYKDGMFLGGSEGTHFNIPQGSNQMKISISSNTQVTCLGARFENPIVHKDDDEIRFAESERQKSKNLFNAEAVPITSSYITYDKDTNTFTYTVNNTIESASTSFAILKYGKLKPGTYTMSFNTTSTIGNTAPVIVAKIDEYDNFSSSIATKNIIDGYVYLTFTLNEETNIGLAWYYKAGWIAGDAPPGVKTLTNLQLEEGSIATDYQSYNGQIVHEKQLPKITTLWTNPNPSNDFSSQTITLANDDYDYAIMICAGRSTEIDTQVSFLFEKGASPILNYVLTNAGETYSAETVCRRVYHTNNTTLNVQDCYYSLKSTSAITANNLLIPYKVIGIKIGD